MPFKPKAGPEDYPERYQNRPKDGSDLAKHQAKNMQRLLGNDLWTYLETLEKKEEGVEWSKNKNQS